MNNYNIFDIKDNKGTTIITTGISGRYGKLIININYNELNILLLEEFGLNILEFIEESRGKGSFIINSYNKDLPKQHNRGVHLINDNLLIQKI